MNKDLTQLKIIVDRSGSMTGLEADMIGGLNELFKEQAELDGECIVDYAQFDTVYEDVFVNVPASEAKAVLVPRGGTALLDAIGKGVVDLGDKLKAHKESDRPGKVIVVVVTDGYENSSQEWTKAKVKELVERQQSEWNWEFVFLGANMDAVHEGGALGFNPGSTLTYDTHNTQAATSSLSSYVGTTRSMGSAAFTDEDREANKS